MKAIDSKILTLLSLVQMWKFFSHFGVRVLLILFMVNNLHYSDTRAFGINAVFCGFVELAGIFGGIIADRYLGLKKSIYIGGWLLLGGYGALFFETSFFLAMGLIITGSSLFSSNITALLGLVYVEDDSKRKKGFTIFYMMQNLGALLSTIICCFIASQYSFRLAFAIASSGMLLGNLMLFMYRGLLQNLKEIPKNKEQMLMATILGSLILVVGTLGVWFERMLFVFLPWITVALLLFFVIQLLNDTKYPRKQIYQFLVYLSGLILFFAVEDQICSSLLLFSERETSRMLFGWMIPSSFITIINPIVILLFGTFIAKRHSQMVIPFVLTGGSFGILSIFCLLKLNCSIFGIMGMVAIISLAELMIGPLVLSYTSKIAGKGNSPGMIMGMLPIAFSLAFQLSGGLSKMVAIENRSFSLQTYGSGFGLIALILLIGGSLMQFFIKRYADEKSSIC
ncbi:MAG: oligopeptide:H+ symporter [Candidatus Rhabdochlamydia sp.]